MFYSENNFTSTTLFAGEFQLFNSKKTNTYILICSCMYLALDSSVLGRMVDWVTADIWTNYTLGIFLGRLAQATPNTFRAAVSVLLHGNSKKVFHPLRLFLQLQAVVYISGSVQILYECYQISYLKRNK